MSSLKVLIMMGSTRNGRNCDRVTKYVKRVLEENNHQVKVADIPLLHNPIHFYPDRSKAPENVRRLDDMVKEADAYVLISAEYNRNMPPALINLLDHAAPRSYAFKTSAIVSYSMGPGAGSMMIPGLRAMMCEFGAPPIPYLLSIGVVHQSLNENGEPSAERAAQYDKSSKAMLQQLDWFGTALKNHRESNDPNWPSQTVSIVS